jgi:tetratricopeptide (TPR) repeat protein
MGELDAIGAMTGTDKSSSVSWGWDYLRHYEELFSKWRRSQINLIEIGIANGSSLAAWERYFDRATLVGIDINPDCQRFGQGRVFVRIGSQDDPGFLHRVAAEFPPTIIIDDGSHIAHHMISAFEVLFPTLQPGGIYIFEDLAFHFEESPRPFQGASAHQGLSEIYIFDYLNKFMRARAACVEKPDKTWGFERYAVEQIDSITVAGGFISVRKRAIREVGAEIAVFEENLASGYKSYEVARRYAEFLVKHQINLDRAANVLQDASSHHVLDEADWNILLQALLNLNRLDEASEAANRQLTLNPTNLGYWDRLAGIERMRSRPDLEIVAMQRLTKLKPSDGLYQLRLSELHHQVGNLPASLAAAKRAAELAPDNVNIVNRVGALERIV